MLKLANISGIIVADIAKEKLQMSMCDLKLEVTIHHIHTKRCPATCWYDRGHQ
jgi:hypothetical protein